MERLKNAHCSQSSNAFKEQINVINRFGKAEFLVAELESGYDFLFIDAGKVDYREHLSLFMDTFNEEAVFVAENIIGQNESVKECLDFMKSTQRFANMTLPGDSELEISVFKTKGNSDRKLRSCQCRNLS